MKVESNELKKMLKAINLNGLILDTKIMKDKEKLSAKGIDGQGSILFNIKVPTKSFEEQVFEVPVFDINNFSNILSRFEGVIDFEYKENKVKVSDANKTVNLEYGFGTAIGSVEKMTGVELTDDYKMVISSKNMSHDFNKALVVEVASEALKEIVKNSDVLSSNNFLFTLTPVGTLMVENASIGNDKFTQVITPLSVVKDTREINQIPLASYFNYGLKEIFNSSEGNVILRFIPGVGVAIESSVGFYIVSEQARA